MVHDPTYNINRIYTLSVLNASINTRCMNHIVAQHHRPVHHVESIYRTHDTQHRVRTKVGVTYEAIESVSGLRPHSQPRLLVASAGGTLTQEVVAFSTQHSTWRLTDEISRLQLPGVLTGHPPSVVGPKLALTMKRANDSRAFPERNRLTNAVTHSTHYRCILHHSRR